MPASPLQWLEIVSLTLAIEAAVLTFALAGGLVLLRCLRLLDQPRAHVRSGGDPGYGYGPGGWSPDDPSGDDSPAWWPAFERDLAEWAAARSPSGQPS